MIDAGSADATFRALFERELTWVWNALRRLGIRAADREDLAQEVFVRVHKVWSSYDTTRPVRPWLFAFVFRVASDFRRLKRHRVEVEAGGQDEPAAAGGPEEELERARRRAQLMRALDALDFDKRAVIVMHEMEGFSLPEVAEALAIPLGTATSRLRAARQTLATTLRDTPDAERSTP